MNKYRGVIFDMDGVIVDTPNHHLEAWRKVANDLGFEISFEQNEELKGVSRELSLQRILKWGNQTVSEDQFQSLMARKNEDYLSRISSMSEGDLLPGVREMLSYLTINEVPFALASASRNARRILRSLSIYDEFQVIIDGNDVTKAKPDPEGFLKAAEELGMKPAECIVFEDSLAGVEAANSVGMLSIGIGDQKVLCQADFNFSKFSDIPLQFIEQLFGIKN